MDDFLARENDVLGDEFSVPTDTGGSFATATGADDIDFDRAASAFPDISLDGSSDIPVPAAAPAAPAATQGSFSFDAFSPPPIQKTTEVKVTGDDEIEKFESEFPEIEVPSQSVISPPATQSSFGAAAPFAPRPQPSALSSTPILAQQLEEEEPEVIKQWREKQAEEIRKRDEASKAKREENIAKAERAIDQFYEEYAAKKEKAIRENKETEEKFMQHLTDSLSTGTTWERICDFIELENSQSKTLARTGAGTTEISRFKEVLLRLRREGESAPGAAGY